MGCSSLVIGEGLHGSNPQLAAQRVPGVEYKWSSLGTFVLYSIFVQLYLQKYSIFVLFVDKIKYSKCPICQYEYDP